MNIIVPDPGLDWTTIYICIGIGVALVLLAIFLIVMGANAWNWDEESFSGVVFGGIVALLITGMACWGITSTNYSIARNTATVNAIESSGYSHVELSGTNFVASRDGKYVRGNLYPLGGNQFQILEVNP